MLINKSIFTSLIILILSSLINAQSNIPQKSIQFQNTKWPFQRIIWTYWAAQKNNTPVAVQACIDNMKLIAIKNNFTFNLVTPSNVRSFIPNYQEQFIQVRKKSIQTSYTSMADLTRMILLNQHGGMWVDSTTIFVHGLTELEHIMSQKYTHMITNRFSQVPDALLFTYSNSQNRIHQYIDNPKNNSQKILYNQFPNCQIWAMAGRKNCSIIYQTLRLYQQFTLKNQSDVQRQLIQKDIFMNRIDDFNNYLYVNMAYVYNFQNKQQQLDRELTLFGTRKSSFQHYNTWIVQGQYGPMEALRQDFYSLDSYLTDSLQQMQQRGHYFHFFMKQIGYFREQIQIRINPLKQIFLQQKLSFQQFINSKPSGEWCSNTTVFLVEGSFMDKMMKESVQLSQNLRIPRVSKQQNKLWLQYCKQNGSFASHVVKFIHGSGSYILLVLLQIFYHDRFAQSKAQQILNYGKQLSIFDRLIIFEQDNQFLVWNFVFILIIIIGMNLIYKLWYRLWQLIISKFIKSQQVKPLSGIQRRRFFNYTTDNIQFRINSNNNQQNNHKNRVNNLCFWIFILLLLNMVMYNAVDSLGGRQQPITIFFSVVLSFILQAYIEKEIKYLTSKSVKYQRLRYGYQIVYLMISYLTTYLVLVHIRKNRYMLNWYSLLIGLVGPCLHKLREQIDNDEKLKGYKNIGIEINEGDNKKHFMNISDNIYRYIVVVFLLITILMPNIRYMAGEEGYYIKHVVLIPFVYIMVRLIQILIRCVRVNLWSDIIRLVILVVMFVHLYYLDDINSLVNRYCRMLNIYRYVFVSTAIFVQLGTSLRYRHSIEYIFNNNSIIFKIFVMFVPIIFQVIRVNIRVGLQNVWWYYRDYYQLIFLFGYIVGIIIFFIKLQHIENCSINYHNKDIQSQSLVQ